MRLIKFVSSLLIVLMIAGCTDDTPDTLSITKNVCAQTPSGNYCYSSEHECMQAGHPLSACLKSASDSAIDDLLPPHQPPAEPSSNQGIVLTNPPGLIPGGTIDPEALDNYANGLPIIEIVDPAAPPEMQVYFKVASLPALNSSQLNQLSAGTLSLASLVTGNHCEYQVIHSTANQSRNEVNVEDENSPPHDVELDLVQANDCDVSWVWFKARNVNVGSATSSVKLSDGPLVQFSGHNAYRFKGTAETNPWYFSLRLNSFTPGQHSAGSFQFVLSRENDDGDMLAIYDGFFYWPDEDGDD
jgi:hypothetical protein